MVRAYWEFLERMKGEKRKRKRKKEWSDLCEDITSLILQQLSLLDRIRFSATCKNSQLESTHYIPQRKLPWIMVYSYTMIKLPQQACFLYEPYLKWPNNNNCNTIEDMTTPPYIVKDEKTQDLLSGGATLCGSRFGWLIFRKIVHTHTNGYKNTYLEFLRL